MAISKLVIYGWLGRLEVQHVLREENRLADLLSWVVAAEFPHRSPRVLLELVDLPSIDPEPQVMAIQELSLEDWTLPMRR